MKKCLLGFAAALLTLAGTASAIVPTGQIYDPSGTITVYHPSTENYDTISFNIRSLLKLAGVSNVAPDTVAIALADDSPQSLYLVKKDGSAIYATLATIDTTSQVNTSHKQRIKEAASISFFDGGLGTVITSGILKKSGDAPKRINITVTAEAAVGSDTIFIKGKLHYLKTIGITGTVN